MDKYEKIAKELISEAEIQKAKEIADINLKYDEYHRAVRKVMDRLRERDQAKLASTSIYSENDALSYYHSEKCALDEITTCELRG